MAKKERINVMGAIKALKVGEKLALPSGEYQPQSVRATVTSIKRDFDLEYSVSFKDGDEFIVVTRKRKVKK